LKGDVTFHTIGGVNTLPRPRKYPNGAEKARAYRVRKAEEREAAREMLTRILPVTNPLGCRVWNDWEALPEEHRQALRRLISKDKPQAQKAKSAGESV
jgi:hypothetical protein